MNKTKNICIVRRLEKNVELIGIFLILVSSFLNTFAQTSTWDGSASPWKNGSGSENDPYLIESAANLAYLSQQVVIGQYFVFQGKYFKLTTNINLNNIEWIPIGGRNMQGEESYSNQFAGSFDGNNKTISNIKINAPSKSLIGLFGLTYGYYGQTIQNIKIISGTIIGKDIVGSIVGYPTGSRIINCENSASITSYNRGGGIVGFCSVTDIINCTNFGAITSGDASINTWLGGITSDAPTSTNSKIVKCVNKGNINGTYCAGIAESAQGTIEDCYNMGNIVCRTGGGIVSNGGSNFTVKNCYNTGNITASEECGGIIYRLSFVSSIITNCYNTGTLSGNNGRIGGIASQASYGTISNCYNIGTIQGTNNGAIVAKVSDNPTITNCHFLNTCITTNNGYGTSQTVATMKTQDFANTLNGTQNPKPWYLNGSLNNGYPSLVYLPFVETHKATAITSNSATLNGNLFIGSENITSKGFRYKKYGTGNYSTISVSGTNFTTTISCDAYSGYLFQAYATTASGTVYGDELSFTTLQITPPSVVTLGATSVTSNSATLNGSFSEGSEPITSKGFRYKKIGASNYTSIPVSGSNFVSTISCEPNTNYFFQAYVTTTSGAVYGDELTFTTLSVGINETVSTKPLITSTFNQINIHFEEAFPFYAEIFDVLGKAIFQGNFNGNAAISVLQRGIYIIKIHYNGESLTQKVAIY